MDENIKIVECPRDAMQGIKSFIPTDEKIEFINQLLKVGYETIDFGSFVSPKAIPQMADTSELIRKLDISDTDTKLLAIIANAKGAEAATSFEEISRLGFPFSLSATFLKRNINSTRLEAFNTIEYIQNLCLKYNKELVVYFSFAFENPYNEEYTIDEMLGEIKHLSELGISIFSMADTVGLAEPNTISTTMNAIKQEFPDLDFGLHLHTNQSNWHSKLDAAFKAGCRRYDSVLNGFGGCPMSGSELVGNLDTNYLIAYLDQHNIETKLNRNELLKSNEIANRIFSKYH